MPKVPVNENRIQLRTANVETMKVGTLSPEIVGNNVYEAQQGLMKTVARAGQGAIDYGLKQQEKENEKKMLEMSNEAFGEIDNILYDPSADDEGRPKGILNRKLGQVGEDSVVEYDGKVNGLISKYTEGLDEDSAARFQGMLGSHARTRRDNVATHQVKERGEDFDNVSQANLKIQIGSAANAQNKDALDEVLFGVGDSVERIMKAKGMDSASIQLAKQNAIDKAIETNIFTTLEANPAQAKAVLSDNQGKVSPEFFQKTMQAIDGKVFENKRSGLYQDVFSKPNYKLSDGEPDFGKIEKTIRASKTFTEPEKEQMVSYAKARAGEDSQNKHRYEKDVINRYSNDVLKLKKDGGTLDEAYKIAGKFGGDNVDVQEREEIARKLWTEPGAKSDPDVLIKLHEKVLTGATSKAEIKQAFADGKVNSSDYVSLTKNYIGTRIGEDKAEYALATKAFKNKLDATYSNSEKAEKNDAMMVFIQKTDGKTPEEAALIGKQLLEETVTDKGWLFDTKKANFVIEKEKIDANNEAWGGLYQNIGKKEVDAIGGGFTRKGAGSWGAADVDKFAQEFGGVDNIKKGTPVNNAINSLAAMGKMATAANVKAVLAIHKDGNIK